MKNILTMLKKIIPINVKNFFSKFITFIGWDYWYGYSWSQEGEDRILNRFFENQKTGFYIDIGAHHPKRFSNTFIFYKRGWFGINIDAMPGSMKVFNRIRPRDINIEMGVGIKAEVLNYYIFNDPALNGFSKEISEERHNAPSAYQIIDVVPVNVRPLAKILDSHLQVGFEIDFMTIDVEGLDFDVLLSNDWEKYRPKIILVEILGSSMHEIENSLIGKHMTNVGYVLYAKCINTVLFKEASLK